MSKEKYNRSVLPGATRDPVAEDSRRECDAMAGADDYATVRVRLPGGQITREALAAAADQLESLGALLADDPEVGGVETRDPTTLEGPQRVEIVAYTVPAARARIQARAAELAQGLGLVVRVDATVHEGDAWRERWKAFYQPRVLGSNALLLRPSWIERRAGDPAREIVLDPGRAFGTGLHETTRLCLDELIRVFEAGREFERVLDLGCGSGILALVAARLFERARVQAVDVDPEATATTRENLALNDLAERVETLTGTIDEVPLESADLVIANIRTQVLVPAAASLAERCRGLLILAGILEEEHTEVEAAFAAQPLQPVGRTTLDGWVCLRYQQEET